MVSFWAFFIEKKQFTLLLMIALIAGGIVSVFAIPKESAPEVEIPVGIVSTILPGAAALDVEKLVTKPIEDEVANIQNLKKLTSTSRDGVSSISAEFDAFANLDEAIADLKDAVDRAKAELPADATDPQVIRINFADEPILIISVSGEYGPTALYNLGESLKDHIRGMPGISKVDVTGVRQPEVTVVIRKESLLQYGISLNDAVTALRINNASLPIGSIVVRDIEYAVRFDGDFESAADVENTPITTRGGKTIYVRDVAQVYDGLERATSYSRVSLNGEPAENALTLYVYKKKGENVITTARAVRAELETLQESMLAGASVTTTFDRGELVEKDLRELSQVGLETVLLVMLSLILTIGWRESLVAGLSIPLSFVIAFIGLYASGNTINFVSLFSLILAIGILVDSGIVMTEAIHTRFKKYGNAKKAAIESLREYAWPLIAGTMTTVAVFLPLFFLSGITGKFIASIPFTVIFVLLASIFVALGFVPIIAIMFTKKTMNWLEVRQEHYNDIAREWYKHFLRTILRQRRTQNYFLGSLLVAFIFTMTLPSLGLVKTIFFPGGDNDFIYIELETQQGTALSDTDLMTRSVEEILYTRTDIESFVTTIGSGSTFNQGGAGAGSKLANITINLPKDRDRTSTEIAEDIRASLIPIDTIVWRVTEPQNGPPTGAPIVLTLTGDNLDNLERSVARGQRLLASVDGVRDVTTSMKDDTAEFVLRIDTDKAFQVGLTPLQAAQLLRTAITGTDATTIRRDADSIDVTVRLDLNSADTHPDRTQYGTLEDIKQIVVQTPRGQVLLGSFITASFEKSNTSIARENRERVATVSAQVEEGTTPLDATAAFTARLSELNLPDDVSLKIGGDTEDVNRTFMEMFLALIAGLLLMLAILVLEFNSFRYTSYLLLTVPLSLIGVFIGLALTGEPLSFPSMLGVIALAGIIINHAIILLDSMYHLIRDAKNMPLEDIVVESAAIRLRPIFLTTITTVLGMIPLAGASDLWGPLAFSVMFGLMFAMVLTLVLIPILFYRWPGKKFGGGTSADNDAHTSPLPLPMQ